jgi:hypothetical protein
MGNTSSEKTKPSRSEEEIVAIVRAEWAAKKALILAEGVIHQYFITLSSSLNRK